MFLRERSGGAARSAEAIAAENGEATLLGTPVSRYKEVVLFVIKDFTGCVTLIGSTTPQHQRAASSEEVFHRRHPPAALGE